MDSESELGKELLVGPVSNQDLTDVHIERLPLGGIKVSFDPIHTDASAVGSSPLEG